MSRNIHHFQDRIYKYVNKCDMFVQMNIKNDHTQVSAWKSTPQIYWKWEKDLKKTNYYKMECNGPLCEKSFLCCIKLYIRQHILTQKGKVCGSSKQS